MQSPPRDATGDAVVLGLSGDRCSRERCSRISLELSGDTDARISRLGRLSLYC
jgi:hypothetical protein